MSQIYQFLLNGFGSWYLNLEALSHTRLSYCHKTPSNVQRVEKCKSFSGFTRICTRDKIKQKLFTSQGKQRRRAEVVKVLQKFMLPLNPACSLLAFGEFEAPSPRFNLFAKHIYESFMIRASKCRTCKMRFGEDLRKSAGCNCAFTTRSSFRRDLPGGSCPVIFYLFFFHRGERQAALGVSQAGCFSG